MIKKLVAIISAISIFGQIVSASVLGEYITSWSIDLADNIIYHNNRIMSEQSGVGQQLEHYAIYTPNENTKPIIVNGNTLWGRRTIKQAEEYMKKNNLVPMLGINASYFSYETGLPMGHLISGGRILSKDGSTYQSIGFNEDGSAFIAPLEIKTTLSFEKQITRQIVEKKSIDESASDINIEEHSMIKEEINPDYRESESIELDEKISEITEEKLFDIDIEHINKYNQKTIDIVNLYTDDYDETNHSEIPALTLILDIVEGELKIGEDIKAVVTEKFNYDSSIKIPNDKIVITVNETAKTELYTAINYLEVGDSVIINNKCNDARWENAEYGLGSVGETLLTNGEIPKGLTGSAAPRTAIGLTKEGNIIFYVIDGRQQGKSYGARLETLAKRMQELGCIEAINLDGGGSTVISGIYPGCEVNEVLNSPSGGTLRPSANYIFLQNTNEADNEFNKIYFYPFEQHYLSGYSEEIIPKAVDTNYYKTEILEDVDYLVKNSLSSYENGKLTARGDGKFYLTAERDGEVVGSAGYYSYETPTEITVYNVLNKSKITRLNLKKDDVIEMMAASKYGYIDLKSTDECYTFNVSDEIGYFDGTKLIITSDGGEGVVSVSAGEYTLEIPVTVEYEFLFRDINDHWAKYMIKEIYLKNIVSGYEAEDGYLFLPDKNMTREEFAVIMGRFLEIDIEKYSNYELTFADNDEISDWSRPYISAMVENSIINGRQSGEETFFAPKDTITRAEAITILGRTLDENAIGEISYDDSASIPEWATDHFSKMIGRGFISGYEDNTIRPNNYVTRAEAVTLLYKML